MGEGREREKSLENHEYLISADVRESLTQLHTENVPESLHAIAQDHADAFLPLSKPRKFEGWRSQQVPTGSRPASTAQALSPLLLSAGFSLTNTDLLSEGMRGISGVAKM